MDWIVATAEWAKTMLQQSGTSPAALPLAFVLGLASAVASACCTLPVLGAIVGYAGMRESSGRRSHVLGAAFFMVGTAVALLILGSVAGLLGQVAQSMLGQYWKIFAGVVAIVVGLGALNLLPVKIPGTTLEAMSVRRQGLLGAALVGLTMGGAVSICSLGCNPGIFIILGVAVLQGYTLWMFGVLIAYAFGFSLPLSALMLGASFGRSALRFQKADMVMRLGAGILLIGVGFYFFDTF